MMGIVQILFIRVKNHIVLYLDEIFASDADYSIENYKINNEKITKKKFE